MSTRWVTVSTTHHFAFTTQIERVVCAERLKQITGPFDKAAAMGKSFVGSVSSEGFRLAPKFIAVDMLIIGTLTAQGTTTLVAYITLIEPLILAGFAFGTLLLLCAGSITLINIIQLPIICIQRIHDTSLLMIVGSLFFFSAGFAVVRFYYKRRMAEQAVLQFLQTLFAGE